MKVFVTIVGLLFIGLQVDSLAILGSGSGKFNQIDELCIAELHLNKDKIAAVNMDKKFLENDEEFTKFMECSGKRQGLISPEGDVIYDVLIKGMHEAAEKDHGFHPVMLNYFKQLTTTFVNECHQEHVSGTNSGITLIKVMNCVAKKLI